MVLAKFADPCRFLPKLLEKQGVNGLHAHDYLSVDLADINPNGNPFAIIDEIAAHMLDWGNDEKAVFEGYRYRFLPTNCLLLRNQLLILLSVIARHSIIQKAPTLFTQSF